jgi:rare lipoprotein A
MERATIRTVFLASVAATALMGCQKAADGATDDAPVARAETSVRLVDRDVEAPQVFQVSDAALWDGRPSLGGVWVASPDAVDPERVILRNPANGKFVIGALFRRERLNPGPALQISSDAAAALGILAGQPSNIDVTALRREEADAAPAPDATRPILDANEAVETSEAVDATTLAAAAIDRAEGIPTPTVAEVPAATDEAIGDAPVAAAEPAVAEEPKRKKGWLFGKRKAAKAEVETAALAASAGVEGSGLATEAIEATPIPVAAVAAPKAPAAQPAASTQAGRGALIQIGIFSVDANADRAVKMLTAKGVAARKLTETSQGKTFWRVVADAPDRAATLAMVKAAGFADAYPVSR